MFKGLTLLAAHEMGTAVRQRAIAAGFHAAAAGIAVMAVVFALNALHDWLSLTYSAMIASLMIAGGLLALALVLALIGSVQRRRRPQSTAATSAALLAAPLAVRGLGRLNVGTIAALGVLAAGAVVGRRLAKD